MADQAADPTIRHLSTAERFTYGECPVCHVSHGVSCLPIGFPLGQTVSGGFPSEGAHLARVQRAPFKVREVPCD